MPAVAPAQPLRTLAGSGAINAAAVGPRARSLFPGSRSRALSAAARFRTPRPHLPAPVRYRLSATVASGGHGKPGWGRRPLRSPSIDRFHKPARTLAGAGSLTIDARAARSASATLAGAGNLTADARRVVQASATLAGDSSLSAAASLRLQASATLAGEGKMAADASAAGIQSATALLQGAGALTANATVIASTGAILAGAGAITATANR